jgi:thiamine kinase-like enzyme
LAEKSLEMIASRERPGGPAHPDVRWRLPPTLVHGDYHEGNILIRPAMEPEALLQAGVTARSAPPGAAWDLVIIDWDSARWDSGFFDLVSLYDVAERMGTCRLYPEQLIDAYLHERRVDDRCLTRRMVHTEWHRCYILRAWDELRWFSDTGEDFGSRACREVGIIQSHLSWFG